eukprot:360614-Chlamydomonas_euryale.AAC.7
MLLRRGVRSSPGGGGRRTCRRRHQSLLLPMGAMAIRGGRPMRRAGTQPTQVHASPPACQCVCTAGYGGRSAPRGLLCGVWPRRAGAASPMPSRSRLGGSSALLPRRADVDGPPVGRPQVNAIALGERATRGAAGGGRGSAAPPCGSGREGREGAGRGGRGGVEGRGGRTAGARRC